MLTKEKQITRNDLEFLNYWFINGHNALKAYQEVHPKASNETAKVNGCRILTKANIKAEIKRQELELLEKTGYSKEQAHQDLIDDRQLARDRGQPSAAISADSQLIRLYGMDQMADVSDEKRVYDENRQLQAAIIAALVVANANQPKLIESKEIEDE